MKERLVKMLGFFGAGVVVGVVVVYVGIRLVFRGHIFPTVYVGSVNLTGLTKEQATLALKEKIEQQKIVASFNGYSWDVPSEIAEFKIEETINEAYRFGRRTRWEDLAKILLKQKEVFVPIVSIDESIFNTWIDTISPSVEIVPIEATIQIKDGKVVVENGSDGNIIDRERMVEQLMKSVSSIGEIQVVEVALRQVNRQLSNAEIDLLRERAKKLVDKELELVVGESRVLIERGIMLSMLFSNPDLDDYIWNENSIKEYVANLAKTYDRESVDARFVMENNRVKEFAPSRDGIKFEQAKVAEQMKLALEDIWNSEEKVVIEIAVVRMEPKVKTGNANGLGIVERIGVGESYYAHSIPGRVHNVGLTASKVTGIIVPPGSEFSFNDVVGEISSATGFAPAYVIKNGRTELGDGGGVCQVSTTMFRAAMNAGFPITERWAHAYRVGYYEQKSEPGIDATVYSPSKDFRFINDSPGHILIQAINDPKSLHLIIEIYGTSDERVAEIGKVKVWGQTAPPPDLYQDDPTLPVGRIKQVDWSAWGAKTTFDYKVSRNGEVIFEKSFPSTYRAWQNVYLRGTAIQ